jgi:hypothetical protein
VLSLADGMLVFESYSEAQLARDTGGPKDLDMLMTPAKVSTEFPNFEPLLLHEVLREVREGTGHTGLASVVPFIGKRPSYGCTRRC